LLLLHLLQLLQRQDIHFPLALQAIPSPWSTRPPQAQHWAPCVASAASFSHRPLLHQE
jgi:hypothetical protein